MKKLILFIFSLILVPTTEIISVTKRIIIHGSGPSFKEGFSALTGFGESFVSKSESILRDKTEDNYNDARFTWDSDGIFKNLINLDCFTFQYNFYNKEMLRSSLAHHAARLYQQLIQKLSDDNESDFELEVFGLSHGGTVALHFCEEVRKRNESASKKIKSIKLITLGTPVCYETNKLVTDNLQNTVVEIKHLHLFSEADRIANMDVGYASAYWQKFRRRFSVDISLAQNGNTLSQAKVTVVRKKSYSTGIMEDQPAPDHNDLQHFNTLEN